MCLPFLVVGCCSSFSLLVLIVPRSEGKRERERDANEDSPSEAEKETVASVGDSPLLRFVGLFGHSLSLPLPFSSFSFPMHASKERERERV